MSVQDDTREKELIKIFELVKLPQLKAREGIDAFIPDRLKFHPIELKSTTKGGVSTARDVGFEHLKKWRSRYWLFGIYSKTRQLEEVRFARPEQLETCFARIEAKITDNLAPWLKIKNTLDISPDDLAHMEKIVRRGITLNDPQIPKSLVLSLPAVKTRKDLIALL